MPAGAGDGVTKADVHLDSAARASEEAHQLDSEATVPSVLPDLDGGHRLRGIAHTVIARAGAYVPEDLGHLLAVPRLEAKKVGIAGRPAGHGKPQIEEEGSF